MCQLETNKNENYIDYIQFCQYLLDKKCDYGNKNVNFELLSRYRYKFQQTYKEFEKDLELKTISKYTSYIPMDYGWNTHLNESLIDKRTLGYLDTDAEFDWVSKRNSLYPIKTLGDANCLCHSVLIYLIGMHDLDLILRDRLKNYMKNEQESLKKRWLDSKNNSLGNNFMNINQNKLNQEWNEIINFKPSDFLEDIHIFALANLLKRTIIIISPKYVNKIQENYLRGIYMPLFVNAKACCKDPILIFFNHSHFMPLLFAFDKQNINLNLDLTKAELKIHFSTNHEVLNNYMLINEYLNVQHQVIIKYKININNVIRAENDGITSFVNFIIDIDKYKPAIQSCVKSCSCSTHCVQTQSCVNSCSCSTHCVQTQSCVKSCSGSMHCVQTQSCVKSCSCSAHCVKTQSCVKNPINVEIYCKRSPCVPKLCNNLSCKYLVYDDNEIYCECCLKFNRLKPAENSLNVQLNIDSKLCNKLNCIELVPRRHHQSFCLDCNDICFNRCLLSKTRHINAKINLPIQIRTRRTKLIDDDECTINLIGNLNIC